MSETLAPYHVSVPPPHGYTTLQAEWKGGFYYIPDFVSEAEEACLLNKIDSAPRGRWKQLMNRRLQLWGGELVGNTLISEPLPSYVTTFPDLVPRLERTGAFSYSQHQKPNHCVSVAVGRAGHVSATPSMKLHG